MENTQKTTEQQMIIDLREVLKEEKNRFLEQLKALKDPFEAHEIEWRAAQSGYKKDGTPWVKVLAYIDARAVMDRLDDVMGPHNWKDAYRKEGNATICTLSLRINGEWIAKEDGSEETDVEAVKGGLSGAMKRAAVKWGISRYLYDLGESFGSVTDRAGDNTVKFDVKDPQGGRKYFYFVPPRLPESALPSKASKMAAKTVENLDAAKAIVQAQVGIKEQYNNAFTPDEFIVQLRAATSLKELKATWDLGFKTMLSFDVLDQARIEKAKDEKKSELAKAL